MRITFIKPKKEFDIDFWQALFCRIWAYLAPTLGVSNVHSIFTYALQKAEQKNKNLDYVRVIADGINLDFLKEKIKKKNIDNKKAALALHNLLSEILCSLTILSGKKVSRGVRVLLDKITKQKGIKDRVLYLPDPQEEETTCFSFDF